jgi:anaerobic ribonucleoside-triphosphate reductase activating protein
MVNGDGIRYVVFCQGCDHHCEGCHNPDTWNLNGGSFVTPESLAEDILQHKHIDGITLSGGDPFYQQEECVDLLKLLPGMNVWIYTGFLYEEIQHTQLAKMANVIVDGLFKPELKVEGQFYGSSNQRIIQVAERT